MIGSRFCEFFPSCLTFSELQFSKQSICTCIQLIKHFFARVYMISIATGFFRGQESKDRSQITHTSTTASNIKQVIVAHMVILHTFDRMMSTSSGSFCYFSLEDSNRAHQCLKIMGVLKSLSSLCFTIFVQKFKRFCNQSGKRK